MIRDDEIFAEALDLPTSARAALLERSCGQDDAMRARIEALLAAYETAGDFLEKSPVARGVPPAEEGPGDVIGRYTLLRKIGEGGWGVVYLAEQKTPVRRRLALKIIKLGMDTRQVITRFEGERQALAMMDHSDIARVFDTGATDAGRPYFVMEYVDGVPVTNFCDGHVLSVAARLELFARVCLAMQHAHRKGIIHRDVKPSNILVALHDGVPAPKVIDFGIAKATQDRLTEHTLFTGAGQFMGTPAYMSPEQADLRDPDIDTRSDIYALGVLLYELLTSVPPFDPKKLIQSGIDEVRRIIREVEPPRPSERFAALTETERVSAARRRHATPPQLSAALRGDLDWIVMRCLEKDRDRRYGSAQELADDVRRHLRHEPVEARPPSTPYRVRKFVTRHRVACASAAAIAATLVAGAVVSVRQAIRATRAERVAVAERADALRRQQQAEDLLTFMLGDFRTELQKIGRLSLLDAVGEKAMAYFGELNPRDLTDTALARQAKALTQIGEIRMDQARYTEASTAFSAAYARAAALAARHPRDGDMLFERAQAEYWIGFAARHRGDAAAEREWLTRYRDSAVALAAIEKTPRAQTELTYGHHNLAVLEFDRGNLADAGRGFQAERTAIEDLLAAKPDDPELQSSLVDVIAWLGSVAERDGRYADALGLFTEMSAHAQRFADREPGVPRWRLELARSLTLAGMIRALQGRLGEASVACGQAEALLEDVVAHDAKNRRWQLILLNARLLRTTLLVGEGDLTSADQLLSTVREKLEALVKADPSSRNFTGHLATAWRLESRLRFAHGRPDASEAAAQAIDLGTALIKENPVDTWAAAGLAQSHLLAGRIAQAQAHPSVAQQHWQRALEMLAPQLSQSTNYWQLLDPAAQALVLLGKNDQAAPLIARLQHFGYHAIDPLAASTLDLASLPETTTKHN